ncbi:uncharacterized protein LOC131932993 [Physella acuta]|uniref:uncharacterized protein LOC131932993 n=1 Tax=Physella acuta TaxID=109671 RepID=UPI0027DB917C|nr:uncharacterized protein LOC131932993 [Physella acuta]XP_059145851.1 uncharacterized protein LOC131932993 [Physella acuta]
MASDTITTKRKGDLAKLFQGTVELEGSCEGEAGLLDLRRTCIKNPKHDGFISVKDFNRSHLPLKYQHDEVFELTKVLAELTVRLAVQYISPDRPDFYAETDTPYPFASRKGTNFLQTGSGRVRRVMIFYEKDEEVCPCSECKDSESPVVEFGEIVVYTATHVVFDDVEARQTTVRFGFDDEDNVGVDLEGVYVMGNDKVNDICHLHCVSHDLDFLQKLYDTCLKCDGLSYNVLIRYDDTMFHDKLTLLVSHPHGCFKQISIGEWTDKDSESYPMTRYAYTAPTCPGSSGAFLFVLGREPYYYAYDHVHSGSNSITNFSSFGDESL